MLWISPLRLLSLCCILIFICFKIVWFLPWSHCWPIYYLITCYLASMSLHIFQFCSCDLISSFIALWSEKMLDMILIFLHLLRLVLYPNMWFILETFLVHLKSMYILLLEWNALKISIKSIWSNVSFKATVSLLIFWLEDTSIEVSGVLKSPTMTVFLCISPFMYIKIFFTSLWAPMLGA